MNHGMALFLAVVAAGTAILAADSKPLTAAQDHRRMMELLHLPTTQPSLPPMATDPNRPANTHPSPRGGSYVDDAHNTYVRSGWGNWSNYDEAKANPYPLPNPLVLKNGERVTDAETWWNRRRPEILNDFLTEIYGLIPAETPKVRWGETRP